MKKLFMLVLIVLALHAPNLAEAVSLDLVNSGNGVYTLYGTGFVNVGGVQIEIQYDAATLQSPIVTKGALLNPTFFTPPNTQIPSIIKIAASSTSPINGTGVLVTIKFTPVSATPGQVLIKSSKLSTIPTLGAATIPHRVNNPVVEPPPGSPVSGVCGGSNGGIFASVPSSNLCSAGITSSVTGSGPSWSWSCAGQNGGKSIDCVANKAADTQTPINGVCGGSNGGYFTSVPGSNYCAAGTTSSVTGSGPWFWSCGGQSGGKSTDCMANRADSTTLTSGTGADTGTGTGGGASVGTITLPSEQGAADRKTEYQPLVTDLKQDMTIPLTGADSPQSADGKLPGKGKQQDNKSVSYSSVLQLFKEFKGERNAKNLVSLFAEGSIPNFSQDPPIVLSDGKTVVRLKLVLKPSGNESPKFILQGASVKQLSSEGEEQVVWIIDALPKKGVHDAKLTVIDGPVIMEFPLVVVPPIAPVTPKAAKFSEADFTLYLTKPAKFDLNKDEKIDSLDDYIYTANYIAALKIKPEKLKKEEKKEGVQPEQKGDLKTQEPAKPKESAKPAESVKPKEEKKK